MKIKLAENFRAVFYAPFYAAISLGWFRESGIDIELVESPTPGSAINQMYAREVDVVWGGPLRAIKLRDDLVPTEHQLYAFCEVVGKDPFYIVEREDNPGDALASLNNKRFGVVNEVPTPWLCLQQDLRDHGIDPASIKTSDVGSMTDNLNALQSGALDAIQVFEPYAAQAESLGIGKVSYAAATRGPTAYTTFLSTKTSIADNQIAFTAMADTVEKFGVWLKDADPREIALAVERYYHSVPVDILAASFERYQKLGIWTCQRNINTQGFARLAQSMLDGGFIKSLPTYEQCTWSL